MALELPPFAYTIDALRVDGEWSADPADYKTWGEHQVIGQTLTAFLKAHLDPKLAPKGEKGHQPRPGQPAEGMTWDLENGVVVVHRPKKADLKKWSRVSFVTLDVYGNLTPYEGPTDPVTLARMILDRLARRPA